MGEREINLNAFKQTFLNNFLEHIIKFWRSKISPLRNNYEELLKENNRIEMVEFSDLGSETDESMEEGNGRTVIETIGRNQSSNKSDNNKQKEVIRKTGFDRGLELASIVGLTNVNDEFYLFVTWKGTDVGDFVPFQEVQNRFSELMRIVDDRLELLKQIFSRDENFDDED